ncbi:hypothetical protein Tco_1504784 [Tanacetum coccineum]
MATLKFASSHNMVAFLDKSTESDGFEQIVDFLNAHPIKYALTVNPIIYIACIEQFWTTAKVQTINGEVQIQALVYKKKVIITATSIRRDLQLADENGIECLPNVTIFAELKRMGYENLRQKLTFYKAFFSRQWKFLIHTIPQCLSAKTTAWNEFSSTMASTIILFLDKQVEGMSKHKKIYVTPSHTKKKQSRRKQRKDTQDSQPSGPTEPMADETENVESVPTHSNDPLLERRNKLRTPGIKRLRKVGRTARMESSEDEGLGNQEDASKQGRVLDEQEVGVKKVVSTAEVTTASATTTTVNELTLAQTLIEIKAAKPKAVTIASTTTTTIVIRPKARGVLAARLQAQEQEELTIKERSKMFIELMVKRKKHFARLRAEEQRRKPQTKAQKRSQMSTYLKHMAGYKQNQLKSKNYDEIQNSKKAEMAQESSVKRAGDELEQEKAKKQKIDDDEAHMKKHIEIVPDDEVAIDAIPLATKPPIIVDWKIIKEGKMRHFQIIRADGSSRRYSFMIKMLESIDREDLETLWKLVRGIHGNTGPEEGYDRVLWGDLKVMFEPNVESKVWRNLQGYKVTVWKLFSSSGVHFVRFQNLHIFMLITTARRISTVRRIKTRERIKMKIVYQDCLRDKFLALGWHLEEIHVTWAHLEKKRTRLQLYTKYLEELRIQSVEMASQV